MQPDTPLNLNDIDTFERVARLGTLTAAAEELGVPKSTVGRRIARLEATLKVALLHRGSRQITLTDSGAELETRSREALRELRALSVGLASDRPRGVLRITVLPDLMMTAQFGSLLSDFRRAYPDVVLDVDANPRVVDLIREGFDVGFRPDSAQPDTDTIIARRLSSSDRRLFASRSYVERRGPVTQVDALADHDWISVGQPQAPIKLSNGDETHCLTPRTVAYGSDVASVLSLLRAGMGIALVPPLYLQQEVGNGSVHPILPGWEAGKTQLLMVWPRQRFLPPRVRVFVDFMLANFNRITAITE
ncbi:MAG: LysR family transcriptional regulator [Myxococcota bacterium]